MQKTFHYTNDSIEFSLKENIFELKGNLFLSETDTQKILFFLKGYNPAPNTEIKFLFKIHYLDGNKHDTFIKELYNVLSQHSNTTFYWLYEKDDIGSKEVVEDFNIPLIIQEIEEF